VDHRGERAATPAYQLGESAGSNFKDTLRQMQLYVLMRGKDAAGTTFGVGSGFGLASSASAAGEQPFAASVLGTGSTHVYRESAAWAPDII
jgi:hypothetical protein